MLKYMRICLNADSNVYAQLNLRSIGLYCVVRLMFSLSTVQLLELR